MANGGATGGEDFLKAANCARIGEVYGGFDKCAHMGTMYGYLRGVKSSIFSAVTVSISQ